MMPSFNTLSLRMQQVEAGTGMWVPGDVIGNRAAQRASLVCFANETTSAAMSGGIPTMVAPTIIVENVREFAVLSQLLYWEMSLLGGPAAAVQIARDTNSLSTTNITTGANEADAQSLAQKTSDAVTITTAVKAVHVRLSDFLVDTSAVAVSENTKRDAARALNAAIETAIATLFASFANDTGTSGDDFSISVLDAAIASWGARALEEGGKGVIILPRKFVGDLRAEAHSGTGSALSTVFSGATQSGGSLDLFGMGALGGANMHAAFLGKYGTMPVIQTDYCQTANGGVDYVGAILAASPGMRDPKCALAGAWKWPPQVAVYDQNPQAILAHLVQGKMAVGFAEVLDVLGEGLIGSVT